MENRYYIFDDYNSYDNRAVFLTPNHDGGTFSISEACLYSEEDARKIVQDGKGNKIAIHESSFSYITLYKNKDFAIIPYQTVYVSQIQDYMKSHSKEPLKFIKYKNLKNE